jgi:DNA polymerase kappa
MPGFHEHDENDVHIDQVASEIDDTGENDAAFLVPLAKDGAGGLPRKRPPHSAPVPFLLKNETLSDDGEASSSTLAARHTSAKPRSTNQAIRTSTTSRDMQNVGKPPPLAETNTCPICEKTMKLDNQAFNAHVDFCLSRETIREAQAQATTPVKRKSGMAPDRGRAQRPLNRDGPIKRQKA